MGVFCFNIDIFLPVYICGLASYPPGACIHDLCECVQVIAIVEKLLPGPSPQGSEDGEGGPQDGEAEAEGGANKEAGKAAPQASKPKLDQAQVGDGAGYYWYYNHYNFLFSIIAIKEYHKYY